MSELKRTPLFPLYHAYGAKTIDFGGWEMPVQFGGILKEHEAVRTQAGLFDVSHMGEFLVEGKDALAYLQRVTTNDVSKLTPGAAQYSLMCYESGGVVDDLLVYCKGQDSYMVVVNAGNIDGDFAWLKQHLSGDVKLTDISSDTALLAIQGPKAVEIVKSLTNVNVEEIGSFRFVEDAVVGGVKALLSRTGYTGEDGFELYVASGEAAALWTKLLEAGSPAGLVPVGLGARDTLRFEARLPLYGQELSADISPLEAGLGFFVKLDKGADFIGRDVLVRQKEQGVPRRLVGIEMIDRGIPRTGYEVGAGDAVVGKVTTGTQSPTLKLNVGLALVDAAYAAKGTELWVDVRGKRLAARVVATPFYKRERG